MNKIAEQHLAKARDYVSRGEEFYRKAAEEIVAAQKADPTLGYRVIGASMERSGEWCRRIVLWHTSDNRASSPHGDPTIETPRKAVSHARSVLRDLPAKEIAELMDEPSVRLKVRQALDTSEPKWTAPKHEQTGPTFIELICKIRDAQQGLDRLMKGWTGPEAIPAEFSPSTFIQVAETAMAQKDRVEQLRDADHDEFQQIIKNFKVVSSVSR